MGKRAILSKLNLKPKEYLLLTIHRQENTDQHENLRLIIETLAAIKEKIVFPVHPRTRKILQQKNIIRKQHNNFLLINPVSYLDMLALEKYAKKILTDSGGVQKEAYWFRVPCITVRNETEWIETVKSGWNVLVGTNKRKSINAIFNFSPKTYSALQKVYGNGNSAKSIIKIIKNYSSFNPE